jgi:hypothetical protein
VATTRALFDSYSTLSLIFSSMLVIIAMMVSD